MMNSVTAQPIVIPSQTVSNAERPRRPPRALASASPVIHHSAPFQFSQ